MIILDTNVVSETQRAMPDARVLAWLDAQSAESLFLTSITLAEMRFGVAVLPEGKRRTKLTALIDRVAELYAGRILPFEHGSAQPYAELMARSRAAGRALGLPDAYIAAIAAQHGFEVATRDAAAFEAAGVAVINPWVA
jgi:predicted nucleic acid-binding protein